MSWTNVFGGKSIAPSNVQYLALALDQDTVLVWPLETAEGVDYLAAQIDVTPGGSGFSIFMPPANQGSTGIATVATNLGADSFLFKDNGGTQIAILAPGETWVISLTDNSTVDGIWEAIQLGATTSNAQAATLAGLGLEAFFTQLRSKIDTNFYGSDHTLTISNRASANIWTGALGTFQLDTIATLTSGWWCIIANAGSDVLTVSTSGPDTIDNDAFVQIPVSGTSQPYSMLVVASDSGFNTFFIPPIPTPISAGGTGADNAGDALTNLGGTAVGVSIFTAPTAAAVLAILGITQSLLLEDTIFADQVVGTDARGTAYVCTAALTLTLPEADTVTTSFYFCVYAQGGDVTITPAAGDMINAGAASADLVIAQGTSLLMVTDAATPGNWWPLFLSTPPSGNWAIAGGTADAITASYNPVNTTLSDGLLLGVRATGANTSSAPTFAPDGLPAHPITKDGGVPLVPGDIAGDFAEASLRYNLANTRWDLLNPAVTEPPWAVAAGSADVITATYNPSIPFLYDGLLLGFRAAAANATATPTFAPDALTARVIKKKGGSGLVAGDIPGNLAECLVRFNAGGANWELLNPASVPSSGFSNQFITQNAASYAASASDSGATILFTGTGAGTHNLTLPDPIDIDTTWRINLSVDSSDGDYITVIPGGAANIGGHGTRIAGVGTDVSIYFDGANFQTTGLFQMNSVYAAFAANTALTLTHNFGVAPSVIRIRANLKNVIGNLGYSAGDVVPLSTTSPDNIDSMVTFYTPSGGNSTKVLICTGITLTRADTFVNGGNVTVADWTMQIVVSSP